VANILVDHLQSLAGKNEFGLPALQQSGLVSLTRLMFVQIISGGEGCGSSCISGSLGEPISLRL
jgi:hypothetical protein